MFGILMFASLVPGSGPLNTAFSDLIVVLVVLLYVIPFLSWMGASRSLRGVALPVGFLMLLGVIWQLLIVLVVDGSPLLPLKDLAASVYFICALALLLPNLSQQPPTLAVTLSLLSGAVLSAAILGEESLGRASGTFDSPNLAGAFAACCFLLAWLANGQVWLRSAIGGLCIVALILTQSFGAIFAVIVSLVYFIAARAGVRRWTLGLIMVSSLVCAYAAVVWFDGLQASSRLDRSSLSRLTMWSDGWQTWLESPWGVGPGMFGRDASGVQSLEMHSDYMQALVETGIVGLALLLLLGVVLWFKSGIRGRSALILAASLAIWRDAYNFRFVWLCLALAIAMDVFEAKRVSSRDGAQSIEILSPPTSISNRQT